MRRLIHIEVTSFAKFPEILYADWKLEHKVKVRKNRVLIPIAVSDIPNFYYIRANPLQA